MPAPREDLLERVLELIPDPLIAWVKRVFEIEGFDRAMVIGAQAFAAFFPLLIVATAVLPQANENDLAGSLINRFDLEGSARTAVETIFATPAEVRADVQLVGAVILILSSLSFVRAMQRLYERSWNLQGRGVKSSGWGLLWLLFLIGWLSLQPAVTGVFDDALAVVVSTALGVVVWLFTPYLLLARRVSRKHLVPTAVFTAIGMSAFTVGSAIVMPHAVTATADEFGAIGVAFALISWTTAAGFVLMATATGGAVATESIRERGQ